MCIDHTIQVELHIPQKLKSKSAKIEFNRKMLAMSTLMMPAPTMACAPPIAVGPHKPPEAKLMLHPTHAQTTPQHQIHSQQQQQQQNQQQQLNSSNKPGK